MTPTRLSAALQRWGSAAVLLPVHVFRLGVSSWLPPSCRYLPSCSDYALQAVQLHGPVHGSWLTARRLLRCHPWCPGGIDEVPASKTPPPYSMN